MSYALSEPRPAVRRPGVAVSAVLLALVVALVVVGCSSDSTASKPSAHASKTSSACGTCLPEGPYTPSAFAVQMTLTLPGQTWETGEESFGEFKMHLASDAQQEVKFLPQPVPLRNSDQSVVHGVGPTPDALAAWLRANPALTVRRESQQVVGGGVQAIAVDVSVRPDAQNSDPACPAGLTPCVTFFGFTRPGSYDFNLAIANHQTVRLLLVPVAFDNHPGTLLIVIDPGTPDHLDALAERTKKLLETVNVSTG
jgi:hypothetical protein